MSTRCRQGSVPPPAGPCVLSTQIPALNTIPFCGSCNSSADQAVLGTLTHTHTSAHLRTNMMVCPSFSQLGKIISLRTRTLASLFGHLGQGEDADLGVHVRAPGSGGGPIPGGIEHLKVWNTELKETPHKGFGVRPGPSPPHKRPRVIDSYLTLYCAITSSDSCSLATNRWLAVGAICIAKRLTMSLNVAEKRRSWT